MGTVADKLAYLLQTKEQIRTAIANQGVTASADTAFRAYPGLIEQIGTGAKLPDKIIYYNNMNGYEHIAAGYTAKTVKRTDGETPVFTRQILDTSGTWVGASVALGRTATETYEIALQRKDDDPDLAVDNSFTNGCPGFTIGGWFNRDANQTSTYYRALFAQGAGIFGLFTNPRYPDYLAVDFAGTTHGEVYALKYDTWYHMALSFEYVSPGKLVEKLYINSELAATYSGSYTIDFHTVSISSASQYGWGGSMKNVFASWGALTQEEIRQMMLKD